MLYVEIAVAALLIAINGLLAMSELAVVSSRPARLRTMADNGISGSNRAMKLAADPGRFLSTVQIGITLVGVLSGAYSGATLGDRFADWLQVQGLSEAAAEAIGVGSVVTLITYASLIIGELVPKQIALRNPERVAVRVAPAMTILARIASPFVSLLDISGRLVLRLFGQREQSQDKITDEEIKAVIAEAESAGVLESDERRMISGVLRLGDRPVRGVMTPRTDVDWIDLTAPEVEIFRILTHTQHSRLPAGDSIDTINGVVQARELLAALVDGKPLNLRNHVRSVPTVYDNADALDILGVLRAADVPLALVHDEYGHFDGIVTPADVFEAIVGTFNANMDAEREPPAVKRADNSWLFAGHLPADEMAEHLGIALPDTRSYQTLAGFILANLERLPATGETTDIAGWRFEIVDLDGRRIDKVIATRLPPKRREAH
jgi:putative hemolysin